MAKIDELTTQVEELKALLAQHGIRQSAATTVRPEDRPDYIAHGSDKHAAFLGLAKVEPGDDAYHLTEFTSPRTGITYRLEDEMGAVRHYPHIDPEKAIKLVLQQKVNELEITPEVPADAPPMFRPAKIYP
jgi:hypothetical protein